MVLVEPHLSGGLHLHILTEGMDDLLGLEPVIGRLP